MCKTIATCWLVFLVTMAAKDVGTNADVTPHIYTIWLPVQIGFVFGITLLMGWLAGKEN